jgi:hypothetical protein
VEVGFATDVTRGSSFSPLVSLPRKEPLEPRYIFRGSSLPDCKVLFLRGELFVVNGSFAEMKAEHLRKFRKSAVSRWSEMAFSEFFQETKIISSSKIGRFCRIFLKMHGQKFIDHRQSYNVQNISCRIRRKIFRPFIYFPMTVFIFVIKTTSANNLRHSLKLQHTSRKFKKLTIENMKQINILQRKLSKKYKEKVRNN